MEWIGNVAKHHKEYVRYVNRMGATLYAEDIVQQAYLRLYKYSSAEKVIREDGTVNKTYVWRVLFSEWSIFYKESQRFEKVSIDFNEDLVYDEYDPEKERAFEEIRYRMYSAICDLDEEGFPYNKELLMLYAQSGMSMRCLSSTTGISLTSIFNTLKNCKELLSVELREDLEDYNNGQYHLI